MTSDLRAGYFKCFDTSIELWRRTRNINSFRVELLHGLRDCSLPCGELRRRASNSLAGYYDKLICRSDIRRKTVDILKKSGECSLLACHSPVRYYNKSSCRADLYNRRQDIFLFWIKFCRWRGDFLCGTLDSVYLHLGVAEKAQDINSFRVERWLGEQDNYLFRSEFRRLAVDCGTPYFSDRYFPCQKLCGAIDISEHGGEVYS